jgi:endonuclease/exonuclease/phosphatase family metal-dependent hydrolase
MHLANNQPIRALMHARWRTPTLIAVTAISLFSPAAIGEDNGCHERRSLAHAVGPTLSVVTLNMEKNKDPDRILTEWRAHPDIWDSDIILMQEVAHFASGRASIAQLLANKMGRYVTSPPSISNRDIDGLAIISRYRLSDVRVEQLDHHSMVFHTRNRIVIAATVQAPLGPLRVYNTHLDSRINAQARLRQIAPIINEAAHWDGPGLIGGDFNTNYFRWVGNVVPVGVSLQGPTIQRAMLAKGFNTALGKSGPTLDYLGLHLDWIYTRDIETFDTAIEPMKFSDHHAVRVTLAPCMILPKSQASSPGDSRQ